MMKTRRTWITVGLLATLAACKDSNAGPPAPKPADMAAMLRYTQAIDRAAAPCVASLGAALAKVDWAAQPRPPADRAALARAAMATRVAGEVTAGFTIIDDHDWHALVDPAAGLSTGQAACQLDVPAALRPAPADPSTMAASAAKAADAIEKLPAPTLPDLVAVLDVACKAGRGPTYIGGGISREAETWSCTGSLAWIRPASGDIVALARGTGNAMPDASEIRADGIEALNIQTRLDAMTDMHRALGRAIAAWGG